MKKSSSSSSPTSSSTHPIISTSTKTYHGDSSLTHELPTLPLRLSVHPHDGCLLTAPLLTVINTATDSLYRDIHEMTLGTVNIAIPSSSSTATTAGPAKSTTMSSSSSSSKGPSLSSMQMTKYSVQTGPMSSLSYTHRRFVLMSQLIHHARSISHVSGLVSAYLPLSSSSSSSSLSSTTNLQQPREGELSHIVTALTNRTLHQVQTSWTQADIAQDTLYFKHADLYKYRKQVHDILGAMDVLVSDGSWKYGMSWDVALFPSLLSLVNIEILNIEEKDDNENDQRNFSLISNVSVLDKENEDGYKATSHDKPYIHDPSDTNTSKRLDIQYRLQRAVQSKLILGEVGLFYNNASETSQTLPWNMTLEQDGCVLKLTYGSPSSSSSTTSSTTSSKNNMEMSNVNPSTSDKDELNHTSYPLVAYLTVLSEQAPNATLAVQEENEIEQHKNGKYDTSNGRVSSSSSSLVAPWTLLSIEVNHQPKMGESAYQLYPTNRQLFDLHRICVRTMAMEESRAWAATIASITPCDNPPSYLLPISSSSSCKIARPLDRLFDTLYSFSLGLQMEILSAQALGLKEGTWNNSIMVEKLFFHSESSSKEEEKNKLDQLEEDTPSKAPLSTLIIHFWSVDDRYGYPTLGNIFLDTLGLPPTIISELALPTGKKSIQPKSLSIVIQAFRRVGMQVSISGGNQVMNILQNPNHDSSSAYTYLQKHVSQLLTSLCDPFQLSMSDAILAATTIAAYNRCVSIVQAFYKNRTSLSSFKDFPCWLHLQPVESGSIAVAAEILYHGEDWSKSSTESSSNSSTVKKRGPTILFHLSCECRTGRFITTFPPSCHLLRHLACNDPTVSETQTLRNSIASMQNMNSSMVKRKHKGTGADKDLTGRFIRDAFEALNRSMDVLGKRTGVGDEWENIDDMSTALRSKCIDQACDDVKASLMLCCGLASTYGIACVSLGISTGIDAMPDIAGGPIDNNMVDDYRCLNAPPLSILRRQELIEREEPHQKNGDAKTKFILKRDFVGVSSSYTDNVLLTIFYDISVEQESLYSAQHRTQCTPLFILAAENKINHQLNEDTAEEYRAPKRMRIQEIFDNSLQTIDIDNEIRYLSTRLMNTL